jgi:hypothetical protein
MKPAAVAIAAALAVAGCTDLPPLGTCGNGIVEATAGEDCDDADPVTCRACRLVCSADLPATGTCPDGELCCLAGQRCGSDALCRAPSGVFASPSAIIPFTATQHTVADVDGDGIGDVFGVNRQQASFLFGGALTRTASVPISTLSRPESQVTFIDLVLDPGAPVEAEGTAGLVIPTARGFGVLVASGGRLASPALPELEFEVLVNGGGDVPDRALIAAPSVSGRVVAVVAEHRSDAAFPGTDRVALRVFNGRDPLPTDDTPCGVDFPIVPDLASFARMELVETSVGEQAIVAITQIRADLTVEAAALCIVRSPPIAGLVPSLLAVEAGRFVAELRAAELDGDPCPEVVAELSDGADVRFVRSYDTELSAGNCTATPLLRDIADGHLVGIGDLTGDGIDEVMIDRDVWRNTLSVNPIKLGLQLPDALDVARVVDVNRDGRNDIVAVGTPAPDLTVILAVDAGYAPRTIASIGALRELATADFDADTYPDVATIESLTDGTQRVVVAFGGPSGPQGFDSIGDIRGVRSLVGFVDTIPITTSDAFADLFMVHATPQGEDEVSQFHGAATRALTSELDLSGPLPDGDGGRSFGRTMTTGELLPPRGDGSDFCAVSLGNEPGPNGTITSAHAFCVGGRGSTLAAGMLDDVGGLTTDLDPILPGETLPALVAAEVGTNPQGEPFSVLVALRRDTYVAPALIVMALPPTLGEAGESIPSQIVRDVFVMPPLQPGFARLTFVLAARAVQLDADHDSELLVTLFDYIYPSNNATDGTFSTLVYRVDLEAPGGIIGAPPATEVIDHAGRDCADAALVELGTVIPDGQGRTSLPGPELVVVCGDADGTSLHAVYRTDDGLVAGPFEIGDALDAFGALAVGDVTGDRLDDLVILSGTDRDATVSVMVQCPAHDTSACATVTTQ